MAKETTGRRRWTVAVADRTTIGDVWSSSSESRTTTTEKTTTTRRRRRRRRNGRRDDDGSGGGGGRADDGFTDYVARKRRLGVHGNHAEIQAMSELYNRPIEVYVPSNGVRPINIFQSGYHARDDRAGSSGAGTAGTAAGGDRRPVMKEDEGDGGEGAIAGDVPIRLCYTNGEHYDALIDPMLPTAGLGLGLPGLRVGLADRMQLEEAKEASLVEGAILEEAKNASMMDDEKMRTALEDSRRALIEREEMEIGEALRASGGGKSSPSSSYDMMFEKKAMYLSEMEAADFDLEQAVKCRVCSFFLFLFLASLAFLARFILSFPRSGFRFSTFRE